MPKYVEAYTDGEDDEVILVPYVKPKPPMILLSGSEEEDEDEEMEQIQNSTDEKQSTSNSQKEEETEDFLPKIQISRNIFEAGQEDSSDRSVLSSVSVPASAPEKSTLDQRKTTVSKNAAAKTAKEQSQSDMLKFIQALGLPLQELPGLDSPPPTKKGDSEEGISKSRGRTDKKKLKNGKARKAIGEDISTQNDLESNIQKNVTTQVDPEEADLINSKTADKNESKRKAKKSATNPGSKRGVENTPTSSKSLAKSTPRSSEKLKNAERRKRQKNANEDESLLEPTSSKRQKKRESDPPVDEIKSNNKRKDSNKISRTPGQRELNIPDIPDSAIFPKKWNSNMKEFYGTIKDANLELDDVLEKQSGSAKKWKTPEDLRKRRFVSRVRCENCQQQGHSKTYCPEKLKPVICQMCGMEGHTSDIRASGCPNSLCLYCGSSQKYFQKACERCLYQSKPGKCTLCSVIGHAESSCPDHWRRYHSTTKKPINMEVKLTRRRQGEDINQTPTPEPKKKIYKPAFSIYCSNCGVQGHNYFKCQGSRYEPRYYPNKPYVIRELSSIPSPPPATPEQRSASAVREKKDTSPRKVTTDKTTRGSVEMLTIQINNPPVAPVVENLVNAHPTDELSIQTGQSVDNVTVTTTSESLTAEEDMDQDSTENDVELLITLSEAEHLRLVRAIDENKAHDIFGSKEFITVEMLAGKNEIQLRGVEEYVEKARLDIFKLLYELKLFESRSKTRTRVPLGVVGHETMKSTSPGPMTGKDHARPHDHFLSAQSSQGLGVGAGTAGIPFVKPGNNNDAQKNEWQPRSNDATAPRPLINFHEDELPNMFDVDERTLTNNQKFLADMSLRRPSGPFGPAPLREYIPVPVPVPVPLADYESFVTGQSGQDFGTFNSSSFPEGKAQALSRAYYKSSREFPQLPQVLPTIFTNNTNKETTPPSARPADALVCTGEKDDKNQEPVSSSQRENSPEIEIIGEIKSQAASDKKGISEEPRKLNNIKESLTVTLQATEWQLFCHDKTQLLNKISKVLHVSISLDKRDLLISIKGGTKDNRKLAQQNVLGFLQAKAANIPFKLRLSRPDNYTASKETSKESSNTLNTTTSSSTNSRRYGRDGKSGNAPQSSSESVSENQGEDSESSSRQEERIPNKRHQESSPRLNHEYHQSDDGGNYRHNYRDDHRPFHNQRRNYYPRGRGGYRYGYDRNYDQRRDYPTDNPQNSSNFRKPQRYFN